jgi:hypothetical protein
MTTLLARCCAFLPVLAIACGGSTTNQQGADDAATHDGTGGSDGSAESTAPGDGSTGGDAASGSGDASASDGAATSDSGSGEQTCTGEPVGSCTGSNYLLWLSDGQGNGGGGCQALPSACQSQPTCACVQAANPQAAGCRCEVIDGTVNVGCC